MRMDAFLTEKWSQEKEYISIVNTGIKKSANKMIALHAQVYGETSGCEMLSERFAHYDMAYPVNIEEYVSLNKYGVVMVAAVAHNKDELPLKRVSLRYGDKDMALRKLISKVYLETENTIKKAFGPYREDSFYMFPAYAVRSEPQLVINWNKNREGFSLKLDGDDKPHFLWHDSDQEARDVYINKEVLKLFLEKEFRVIFAVEC